MFNLFKVVISNYTEKVLLEMFRSGNIVDVQGNEEDGSITFKAYVGERRADYMLMDETELQAMVEARLTRAVMMQYDIQYDAVVEATVKQQEEAVFERYEIIACIRFFEGDTFGKDFHSGCVDTEQAARLTEWVARGIFEDVEPAEILVEDDEGAKILVIVSEINPDYKELLMPGEVDTPDYAVNYPLEDLEELCKRRMMSLMNKYYPTYDNAVRDVHIMREPLEAGDEVYSIIFSVDQGILTNVVRNYEI